MISQEEREAGLQKTSCSGKEFDLCPKGNEKLLENFKLAEGTSLHFE